MVLYNNNVYIFLLYAIIVTVLEMRANPKVGDKDDAEP
jgi:hypothetical protein